MQYEYTNHINEESDSILMRISLITDLFPIFEFISNTHYISIYHLFKQMAYLHFFGLSTALVAKLHQRHHHGQTQTSNQDVKDSCYVAKRQSAGLLLVHRTQRRGKRAEKCVSGCFYINR